MPLIDDVHNLEKTGYMCASCEGTDPTDTKMVFCEGCQQLFHSRCVGVPEENKNQSWVCEKCTTIASADETAGAGQSSVSVETVTDLGADKLSDPVVPDPSLGTKIEELWKTNEKEQEEADKLHKRKLEQMLEMRRRNFQRQLMRENETRLKELELEREMLEIRQTNDADFKKLRSHILQRYHREEKPLEVDLEGAVGGSNANEKKKCKGNAPFPNVSKQDTKIPENRTGAYPKNSTPNFAVHLGHIMGDNQQAYQTGTPLRNPYVQFTKDNNPSQKSRKEKLLPPFLRQNDGWTDDEDSSDSSFQAENHLTQQLGEELTRSQLAARKGPFQKLPIFSGRPEEWPLFISSFNNGNLACNWSNLDNLGRLQESIKGPALEAVRSRLLLPESVPQVIETLRILYGRPEQLLHSLLQKARKAEPPRIDRLSTFINFGMVVQQLCDHLVASKLVEHLVNPMLIQELIDKLPSNTKLEWVRYKRRQKKVTLKTFSDFLSEIVSEASDVTLFVHAPSESSNRANSGRDRQLKKQKEKEQEGFLHAHIGVEEQKPSQTAGKQQQQQQHPQQDTRPSNRKPCRICNRTDHRIRYCEDFTKLPWNERSDAVKKWKLCQLCLNEHGQSVCRFKNRCNIENCHERHHTLLHPPSTAAPVTTTECNVHNAEPQLPVIFRMVPIRLYNGERSVDVLAFLDEGSSYSLVESCIADQIQLSGTRQPILVKWTAGMSRLERESQRLDLSISSRDSKAQFNLRNVHTVDKLQLPEQELRFADVAARYKHLRGLPVADYGDGSPKILIGLKHLHVYAPLESRIGNAGEPIAVRTKLGWTVYGPQSDSEAAVGFAGYHESGHLTDKDLHDILRTHYTLEESGVSVTVLPESAADRRARDLLEKTTVRVGDRFETGLLWKNDNPELPDSYPMAVKRMKSLERKLERNPALQQTVQKQINDYQVKGYAHKATPKELAEVAPGKVWYLPLNVVLNPKKPSKVRMVWDAAASVQGKSLNSELLKGPDLLTSLPAVISRFRERRVAFGGDIQEMYHQLLICKADKQAQRFLYRPDSSGPPVIFVMDVATFGSTSSPCSAQYVKNRNAQDYAEQFPDAVEAIIDKHYVDDYFDSTDTVAEAVKRANEVRLIHSKAGFLIRNWVSNSSYFLERLGEQSKEPVVHFSCTKSGNAERVLGVSWDSSDDVFMFSTRLREDLEPYISGEKRPTKRAVLSCVMSLFDPLGLLAPFTVHGKMIIQDLWRAGCSWDEEVDDNTATKWKAWTALMPKVEAMKIPRCYFAEACSSDYDSLEMHVFTDASENAYGCVVYFRMLANGYPKCALVAAKSKVAPLQHLSIPRLELQAAVLGARMGNTVQENHSLPIKRRYYWTDSLVTLSWIISDHKLYKQYVGVRTGEIRTLTNPKEWRWVPTKQNIADVLTKWGSGPPMESDGKWINGPGFLYLPEDQWPQRELPSAGVREELRSYHLFHEISITHPLLDTTRISRWTVLVRSIASVYRFISNCRKKVAGKPIETLKATSNQKRLLKTSMIFVETPFRCEEYRNAENFLWRSAQSEVFGEELKILLKNRELPLSKRHSIDRHSSIYRFSPFLDEGVIRMEGRTAYADFLSFELRFPIILPKGHDITLKILDHYHRKFGHANRETVVNEVRQRFYVPKLRAAVNQIMKSCMWCKVHKCQPKFPRMAPLPVQRLTPQRRPFSFVGIDYFGPVIVTVGRRSEKRWVALITCLTTRAVHMEVAHSLTVQACVMAIRRFICRRGAPLEIYSDNATNFKAASKELIQEVRRIDAECAEIFTDARTRWNFIPPAAPHMGGSWERLVRSAKEALKSLHDGRTLSDEVLLTVLAEAEDMVNSRPLTYVPMESAEAEALTPNHFLRGFPPGEREEVNIPADPALALRDDYVRTKQLADMLWERWLKEYIPSLNQRTKWYDEREPVEEGELVYVVNGSNRRTWIRGVVEKVIRAQDGRVRQAMVRTSGGVILKRPIAKLAVLELRSKTGQDCGSGPALRAGELLTPLDTTLETLNNPAGE